MDTLTYWNGTWHEGNPAILGPRDHAFWLGSMVFDGGRAFEGCGPDLDLHAERVVRSARALGLEPTKMPEEILKLLHDGVPRVDLRASWGGAMGLTQFLPSEYYKYAVDLDGDGRADIWHSVPDALASAAKQLKDKGCRTGEPWAVEVRVPASVDCTLAEPSHLMPIGDWLKAGYVPAYGRKLPARDLAVPASLLLPEGTYGPGFLTPKNYYVLKEYNYSDLYVLFVGHLSDRIAGGKPFEHPWMKSAQLKTTQVEAMQDKLTALGMYKDKIDGKAGMLTRAALGAYQKQNGLKIDCWPTADVLTHMTR